MLRLYLRFYLLRKIFDGCFFFQSYPCVGTHFALALSRIRSRGRSRNGYQREKRPIGEGGG